jgi:hypothetical protein
VIVGLTSRGVVVVKRGRWFHGYISFQDTVRLLNLEPVGTFLIRQREMLPGSFALCFVMPHNKVFQIPISPNELHGFKLKVRPHRASDTTCKSSLGHTPSITHTHTHTQRCTT